MFYTDPAEQRVLRGVPEAVRSRASSVEIDTLLQTEAIFLPLSIMHVPLLI